jgi:hypothetical protein
MSLCAYLVISNLLATSVRLCKKTWLHCKHRVEKLGILPKQREVFKNQPLHLQNPYGVVHEHGWHGPPYVYRLQDIVVPTTTTSCIYFNHFLPSHPICVVHLQQNPTKKIIGMLYISLKYVLPMTINNLDFWYTCMHVTILEKFENWKTILLYIHTQNLRGSI